MYLNKYQGATDIIQKTADKQQAISKTADVKISGVGGGLFAQGVTPTAFGQGSRIMRYKTYQAIVSTIN